MYCQTCGVSLGSKPAITNAVSSSTPYAGFWIRFVAWIIDAIVVSVAGGLVTAITFGAGILVALCGSWLYEAFMLSSEWQATVGKRAMSIAVTGVDGGRISFARASGRHFAKYISACLIGIGYIMAAFTTRKQALHDLIAETLVINKTL